MFPSQDVRFIAINDNVDSDNGENEFAPFKNIINEWYARDISRKIKSSFRIKAQNGEFIAGRPAYGYRRDPEDKHHLIPDAEMAPVVQRMFQMALEGKSCYGITRQLKADKIPKPDAYIRGKDGTYRYKEGVEFPYDWMPNSVREILSNRVYLGHLVSLKTTKRSFKDKRVIQRPEEEWVIVRDTHEALVDEDTFAEVQERIRIKHHRVERAADNLYIGLLRCADCGLNLNFTRRKGRKSAGSYTCNKFKRYGVPACTAHYITLEQLNTVLLADIRKYTSLAEADRRAFAERLAEVSASEMDGARAAYRKELDSLGKRTKELDILIQQVYEDHVFGKLSDERYETMAATYEAENGKAKARIAELQGKVNDLVANAKNAEEFADLVAQYADIEEMTTEIAHTLIDRIEVHDKEEVDGEIIMRIDIFYRFVGKLGDGQGHDILAPKIRRQRV